MKFRRIEEKDCNSININTFLDKCIRDERERIISELIVNAKETISGLDIVELEKAIEIVRGEQYEENR